MFYRLKLVVLLVFCVASTASWAACQRNGFGIYEDGACASQAFSKADKNLNAIYKQLLSVLDDGSKVKLRAAQRAWVSYRDAHARYVFSVEGDGSAGRMVASNDGEQQTQAQIKELCNWLPKR